MSFRSATRAPETLTKAEQRTILTKTGETRGAEREHMIYSFVLGTAVREHELAALNVGDVVVAGVVKSRILLQVFKGRAAKKAKQLAASPARKPPKQVIYLPRATRRKLGYFLTWKKKTGESLAPASPLFCTSKPSAQSYTGDRISTRTLRHHWHRWQRRCGFETIYGFHVLRHTSLSNLYRKTKDILVVKDQARHTHVTTTEIYTHVEEDVRVAVEDLEC